jgi:hypothetical protein
VDAYPNSARCFTSRFIGDDAGLAKAVHAFADFDEDMTVVDEIVELILLHYAGWTPEQEPSELVHEELGH